MHGFVCNLYVLTVWASTKDPASTGRRLSFETRRYWNAPSDMDIRTAHIY